MKRMLSIIVALVLVFSLGVTAVADESDNGTITITNPVKDESYSLYKIFDATYAVDADGNVKEDDKGNAIIAYTIDNNNQFFDALFGVDGKTQNAYFALNITSLPDDEVIVGEVSRKEGTDSIAILDELERMVQEGSFTAVETITASGESVVFDGLDYGYYVIDKGNASAVTITSAAPNAVVIDKNEKPAQTFGKLLWDEEKKEWVTVSSGNIGDIVEFKIDFSATNYDGEHKIRYYTVKDTKGSALWVEFNDITVTVAGEELERGYYHCATPGLETNEWKYFGNWSEEQKASETSEDNAQWYLIHRGYDEFDIVIPWLEGHNFTGTTNGFTLEYTDVDNAEQIYDSPVKVTVEYSASVEPGATIGPATENTLWNTAKLSWTSNITGGRPDNPTTQLRVYALGLIKEDADTEARLANAVFELYRDDACTKPVYVIPTNIKGVYILDDLNTIVSGKNRDTSREKYAAYLEDYLGPDYATTQKNVVTSEANGKLLILGLEEGNYFLKETEAPDGYNKLAATKMVAVGSTNDPFFVIADANGNVVDLQSASEGYIRYDYDATVTTVENSRGIELPSTGGEGTMMLITIGTVIALAFAVLLITHKKMSVYHD